MRQGPRYPPPEATSNLSPHVTPTGSACTSASIAVGRRQARTSCPTRIAGGTQGRGIQWQAGVTSKLAQDDRMLELAAASGCTLLSIGFESISRSTLTSVHKHVNQPGTFAALVEKVHSYGITTCS